MVEPISSSLLGVVKYYSKYILGIVIVSFFVLSAWVITIALRVPTNHKEWIISIFSTLTVSIGGGSIFIAYLDLYQYLGEAEDKSHLIIGLAIIGFIFFMFGLLGWALIRIVSRSIEESEGLTLMELIENISSITKITVKGVSLSVDKDVSRDSQLDLELEPVNDNLPAREEKENGK